MSAETLPKITIVTPCLNQAAYVEQTILSVLGQGYPNLEYIMMDGGSSDGSVEIIRKYTKHFAHFESQPDAGHADAINRGFAHATGEILGWVNSDDLLLPGSLFRVARFFQRHPAAEWVVGGHLFIGACGEVRHTRRLRLPACDLGRRVGLVRLLSFGCDFVQPAAFWKRDVFFQVGGLDASMWFCFDYDFFIKLAARGPSGRIRPFLAAFRIHPCTKTSTRQDIRKAEDVIIRERYAARQQDAVCPGALEWLVHHCGPMRRSVVGLGVLLGFLRSGGDYKTSRSSILHERCDT